MFLTPLDLLKSHFYPNIKLDIQSKRVTFVPIQSLHYENLPQ